MGRALVIALGLAATTLIGAGKPPADSPQHAKASDPPLRAKASDAPADEYFGPFKYSALSVRSKITALGRSYRERWADDASIVHDAGLVESSYRAWAQKYPKDVWLAPTGYHLAQLYQVVQTSEARAKAKSMYEYVAATYSASKEAHFARLRLQQGFPELHAESPVSPTPSPYGPASASPSASTEPSPGASSTPGPPAASAAPAPAPGASAKPAPAASATPAKPLPVVSAGPVPRPSPSP